jgi:hypothetical protein
LNRIAVAEKKRIEIYIMSNKSLKRNWVADNARDHIGASNIEATWGENVTLTYIRQYGTSDQLDGWAQFLADNYGLTPPWVKDEAIEVESEVVVTTPSAPSPSPVALTPPSPKDEDEDEEARLAAIKLLLEGGSKKKGGIDEEAVGKIVDNKMEEVIDRIDRDRNDVNECIDSLKVTIDGVNENLRNDMSAMGDGITKKLDTVLNAIDSAPPVVKRKIKAAVSGGTAPAGPIAEALVQYTPPGDAREPLAIYGEPGVSKTHDVVEHSKMFDVFEVVNGHDGLGLMQVVGSPMLYGEAVINVYGIVARAFKAARDGKTTLLLMDEFTRLNARIKGIFVTALNVRHDKEGVPCYVLQLPIPLLDEDGNPTGCLEEIWAPAHLLAIVATANEGKGFNTSYDDPAEKGRWHKVRVQYDSALALKITKTLLERNDYHECSGAHMVSVLDRCRNANFSGNMFSQPATLRDIVKAINSASSEDDLLPALERRLTGQIIALDSKNMPNETHVKSLKAIVSEEAKYLKASMDEVKSKAGKVGKVQAWKKFAVEVGGAPIMVKVYNDKIFPSTSGRFTLAADGGSEWTVDGGGAVSPESPPSSHEVGMIILKGRYFSDLGGYWGSPQSTLDMNEDIFKRYQKAYNEMGITE